MVGDERREGRGASNSIRVVAGHDEELAGEYDEEEGRGRRGRRTLNLKYPTELKRPQHTVVPCLFWRPASAATAKIETWSNNWCYIL